MSINPRVKDILLIIGVTGFVAASLVMPGLPKALSPFLKKQYKKWGHFNQRRLRSELSRLEKRGVIEKVSQDGQIVFRMTDKGKDKLIKYHLDEISLKKGSWDKKWRLVAYDISKDKKNQAEAFRSLLKKMGFLKLQKSLWLTPYQCDQEIEFLRNLYSLGSDVTVLTITGLKGETAYKQYFGL